MKIKKLLLIALTLCSMQAFAVDGYLSNLNFNKYVKTSFNYSIQVWIRNASGNMLGCQTHWQLDGGTVNTNPFNFSSPGITSSSYYPATLTPALTFPSAGNHTLKVWITATGETNYANDTITKSLVALSNYVDGNVLVELLTGIWCPNCPPADAFIDQLDLNPRAVVATFHGGDILDIPEGQTYMENYFPSSTHYYPSGVMNMGEMGGYAINSQYPQWQSQFDARLGISPVDIHSTSSINIPLRQLTVNTTVNFKYAFAGDFLINVYVLENGVDATQNTPSGYINYTHNQVVRHMFGGTTGITGVIPASPAALTDYTHQDILTIPASWDIASLKVVAIVYERNGSLTNALNAAKASPILGVNDIEAEQYKINIYPNPSQGAFTLENDGNINGLEIYNMLGEKIYSRTFTAGNRKIMVDMAEQPKGIYLLQIRVGEKLISRKLEVN
jgi:Outer membrane protein Omp28/Secretion system C-terminal sorting domain